MKDYLKKYNQFTSSYYFTDGLRITSAVIIPILLFAYLGHLSTGISFAIGTMFISFSDLPGSSDQRRAGAIITTALIFTITVVIGLSVPVHWLLVAELLIFTFFFSMLGIYGPRASAVGLVTMFFMVLNLEDHYTTKQIFANATMGMLGGCWYFVWSLAIYNIHPFRLARQSTGDYLLAMAGYLELNADFYDSEMNDKSVFNALFNSQAEIYNRQRLAREILYKKYRFKNETGKAANIALIGFVEAGAIFNLILAAQREYRILYNEYSPPTRKKFKETLLLMAEEMHRIGIHVQKAKNARSLEAVAESMYRLEEYFNSIDPLKRNAQSAIANSGSETIENSPGKKKKHEEYLNRYFSPDNIHSSKLVLEADYTDSKNKNGSVVRQFSNNLHFQSDFFRHALRLTLAVFMGYIITGLLPVDHKYWVLITVMVILKPTFQLSRKRNFHRLAGTFTGAAIAIAILFIVRINAALLTVFTLSMLAAFSLMRIQYFLCSAFITIYIVIGLHLLHAGNLSTIVSDRLIDTLIGSGIAFIVVALIPLIGENGRSRKILVDVIEANKAYAGAIAVSKENEISVNPQHEILRKHVSRELANLSDAFQRLQYAPNSKQEKLIIVYRCITVHNLLFTHISMLIATLMKKENRIVRKDAGDLIQNTLIHLSNASKMLTSAPSENLESGIPRNKVPGMITIPNTTGSGEEKLTGDNITIQFRTIFSISANIGQLTALLL